MNKNTEDISTLWSEFQVEELAQLPHAWRRTTVSAEIKQLTVLAMLFLLHTSKSTNIQMYVGTIVTSKIDSWISIWIKMCMLE